MIQRGLPILKQFIVYLLLFICMKLVFVFFHARLYETLDFSTVLSIIKAGFPLDVTMSSYLVALPLLIRLVSVFITSRWLVNILLGYNFLISIAIGALYILDLQLYSYWGFRLDSTPVFYFLSSPNSAMASITTGEYVLGIIATPVLIIAIYKTIRKVSLKPQYWLIPAQNKLRNSIVLLFAIGLCFLGIRGGWTVSTMNVSRAYFSTDEKLNQAAINPLFSFMESAIKDKNFGNQFQYMELSDAVKLVSELHMPSQADSLSAPTPVLNTDRPDIFLVILESFSIPLMESQSQGRPITPNLNQLSKEGIFFSSFYANSFRTDRGLAAILSGYPAQPNTSIMKYPRKAQKLPMISESLASVGYRPHYFYGGDINFTNQKAFLKSGGYTDITSDVDFPITQQLSKWGVDDHFVFEKVIEILQEDTISSPIFYTIQTSSSHEPFDAPVSLFENNKENAFAYTDACIGDFIAELKRLNRWENSLVIFVPDHQGGYPENLPNDSLVRYHIPLIWTGGAVANAEEIKTIGSQIDIAATLLAQLNLPTQDYTFSKNMLSEEEAHFGYFAFPSFAGLWDNQGGAILNLQTDSVQTLGEEVESKQRLNQLKALLQIIYQDLDKK